MKHESRQLAEQLRPGEHQLANTDLRRAYGLSRVTAATRHELARELRQVGLEILSDPATEPLVVRKPAATRSSRPRVGRPRWRRPWVIAAAGLVALMLLIGALSDEATTQSTNDTQMTAVAQKKSSRPATEQQTTATLGDAAQRVDDDRYAAAIVVAASLSDDAEQRIVRKISRRLAYRAMNALHGGNRSRARFLINRADGYTSTPQSAAAWARYDAARQQAVSRRAAARRREKQRQAQLATTDPYEPEQSAPPTATPSGASTTNWCGKRDGDGDGIYCE